MLSGIFLCCAQSLAQLCPILCNSMDCSPPGSSVQGGFSRQEYWSGLPCPPPPGDLPNPGIKSRSPALQADFMSSEPPGKPKNTGVGCHSLLQRIFPTQRLNLGFLHCRWILHHLSHQGSPRILEWVAYPFSRGSSQPRNQTRVSCIADRFFTISAIFQPRGLQHTRPLCPSPSLTACSNSCPLSW